MLKIWFGCKKYWKRHSVETLNFVRFIWFDLFIKKKKIESIFCESASQTITAHVIANVDLKHNTVYLIKGTKRE